MTDYSFIADNAALALCVDQVIACEVVVLDTEFMRTDTFFPIPALLQLSDGVHHYLIDPLSIDNWEPLKRLFQEPSTIKVLHSVSEDLEVFQQLLGVLPQPLLDTQVGAALAGFGFGLGYQRLLDSLLGIAIVKDETRSNWLQRPLSDAQCEYAVLDVVHLMPAFDKIRATLEQQDRMHWWLEEGARCVARALEPLDAGDYFRKIKTASRLSASDQLCLRALCAWREQTAREQNVPRGRIVKDAVCIELAKRRPSTVGALARIKGVMPSSARRYGDALCELVAQDYADDGSVELETPLNSMEKKRANAFRAELDALSERAALPRELLASKKDVEECVRLRRLSPNLNGWRRDYLQPILDEVFKANA